MTKGCKVMRYWDIADYEGRGAVPLYEDVYRINLRTERRRSKPVAPKEDCLV